MEATKRSISATAGAVAVALPFVVSPQAQGATAYADVGPFGIYGAAEASASAAMELGWLCNTPGYDRYIGVATADAPDAMSEGDEFDIQTCDPSPGDLYAWETVYSPSNQASACAWVSAFYNEEDSEYLAQSAHCGGAGSS